MNKSTIQKPSLCLTAREFPAAVNQAVQLAFAYDDLLEQLPKGNGQPVWFLPGFLTHDVFMKPMAEFFDKLGYDCKRWNGGLQLGPSDYAIEHNVERLQHIYETTGEPVIPVGWSYGGVMARAMAQAYPEMISQIITLGSPHRAGVHESSTALTGPFRLATSINQKYGATREFISKLAQVSPQIMNPEIPTGTKIDLAKGLLKHISHRFWKTSEALTNNQLVELVEHPIPEIPCTNIYTRNDGIVNWQACVAEEGRTEQNIEVFGSHVALPYSRAAYVAVAHALSQPVGNWQKFNPEDYNHLARYPDPMAHKDHYHPPITTNPGPINSLDKILPGLGTYNY